MRVTFYRIRFPSYSAVNEFECPIVYYCKKYSLYECLPLPRAKKYVNNEYIAVIPCNMEDEIINILVNLEDCKVSVIKREIYENEDFENTYVYEVNENIGGLNITSLSIFKRLMV